MLCVPSNSAETVAPPGRLLNVPLAYPGVFVTRLNAFRVNCGRLKTCLVSKFVDSALDSVWTRGDSDAVTVIDSVVVPTLRVALTSVSRLVWMTTDSKTWFENPCAETVSVYVPPGKFRNRPTPFACVVA